MMIKPLLISILVMGMQLCLFGQSNIESIQQIVNKIDIDSTLTLKEFDIAEVYQHADGTIKLYFDHNELKKINQEIAVSFGRLTTIIYFDKEEPIKIIDREENFTAHNDHNRDYSELKQVFQADIYIFDWEMDNNKTIKEGKREFSEGTCAIFDYEPLIDLVKQLLTK